jgi:prepilin-type N-terminal cleavage/methylation domain-containing protein
MKHDRIQLRSAVLRAAGGFTLVEILLALALAAVLMGAVYTAIELYRQTSTSGREQIEREQVVRAIHGRIAVDIRSVVFTPPSQDQAAGGAEGQAADDAAAAESTTPVEVINPEDAITGTAGGIVGDMDSLVLHISKPPRGMAYTSTAGGGARSVTGCSSDLLSVTYLWASPNGPTSLSKAVAAATGKSGLARLQGDRLAMNTADLSGNVDELAKTAIVLAEEVVSVKFEYLDGTQGGTPLTAWDSKQQGKLPRAVRVTLELKPKNAGDGSTAVTNYTQSFLIAVPVADPKPADLDDLGT